MHEPSTLATIHSIEDLDDVARPPPPPSQHRFVQCHNPYRYMLRLRYMYTYMYVNKYMNPSMYILYCLWSKADLTYMYAVIAYLHVLYIYMRTDCSHCRVYCLTQLLIYMYSTCRL